MRVIINMVFLLFQPFLSINHVILDETLLRCSCQNILNTWMDQLERPIFSVKEVACLDGNSTPCLNVPLRDERIETEFDRCNVVEAITMETPSMEVDEFDDF